MMNFRTFRTFAALAMSTLLLSLFTSGVSARSLDIDLSYPEFERPVTRVCTVDEQKSQCELLENILFSAMEEGRYPYPDLANKDGVLVNNVRAIMGYQVNTWYKPVTLSENQIARYRRIFRIEISDESGTDIAPTTEVAQKPLAKGCDVRHEDLAAGYKLELREVACDDLSAYTVLAKDRRNTILLYAHSDNLTGLYSLELRDKNGKVERTIPLIGLRELNDIFAHLDARLVQEAVNRLDPVIAELNSER